MAFYSGFFNSKGLDRTYTAEDFTSYLSGLICNGIQDTYGQNFKLTAASSGLKVTLGTGKAWLNGHYFVNDSHHTIDLTEYQDESFPRYVSIAIVCDTSENVRAVRLEIIPGTPAENPTLPTITTNENRTRLLLYAVRLNVGVTSLTEHDWYDYREDSNVCGYCKCILGKCKVTDMLSLLAETTEQMKNYNTTVLRLTNQVAELTGKVDEITGDIVSVGKCGDDINYVLYSDGKLILKGTGEMYDYASALETSGEKSPFYENDKIKSVVISEGITSVGEFAFIYCNKLKSAILPTTLTTIKRNGFMPHIDEYIVHQNLYGLMEITIPANVTEIGKYAFSGTAIQSLTIPESVTIVGEGAFGECQNLETVRYSGKVIGDRMFVRCIKLKNFTITKSTKEIVGNCFNYCENLTIITYEGSLADWTAVAKQGNWDGNSGINPGNMHKVQCLDGYMQYDSETQEWMEVHE